VRENEQIRAKQVMGLGGWGIQDRPGARRFGPKGRNLGDVKDLMSGGLGGLGSGVSGLAEGPPGSPGTDFWASPEILPLPERYFRARASFHRSASDLNGEQGQSRSGI
jgi:hypothetical protein